MKNKFVKLFEEFNIQQDQDSGEYRYLILTPVANGLEISFTTEGLEEIKEIGTTTDDGSYAPAEIREFFNLFEDIAGNSEYLYHEDIGRSGFGLTSAPGITYGYHYNEDDEYEENEDGTGIVYYYPKYAISSFIDEMIKKGKTFFEKAS